MNGVEMKTRLILIAGALLATLASVPVYSQEEESSRTLFTNVNIFDGVNEELAVGMSVLVEGNLISEVATAIPAQGGAAIIDGGGRTLMPGLIDSHVHLTHMTVADLSAWEGMSWDEMAAEAMRNAREFLMSGFTTVRDMGGTGPGIKRAVDRGLGVGPRIYPAGPTSRRHQVMGTSGA